jgi:tetratricopeptide (TPR) repeat protein
LTFSIFSATLLTAQIGAASKGRQAVQYLDVDMEIGAGSGRDYPVAVLRSPAGEARAMMRFPFDDLALENYLLKLQNVLVRSGGVRRRALSPQEQGVQEFGQRLFDALLTNDLRSCYDVSRREAAQHGMGVRLRLRIQAPELAALPWEYLYDSRQADYLCLSRQTLLVRYLEVQLPIQPLLIEPPLRILSLIASPTDLDALDMAREQERMSRALQDLEASGQVEVTWLEGQTWRHVQRAMRAGPWHVFHFIGHGGFDPNADEGVLALANDEGKAHLLHATELGRLLANHETLRMVILNACEGAKGSQRDIFSSTAATLARRGIPAVLAMQEEITDQAAIECTRAFYEALSDGLPVDAAVAEARTAISVSLTNTLEWGTPVLYMRAPDGVLFDLAKAAARPKPKPAPTPVAPTPPPLPPSRPAVCEAMPPSPGIVDDPAATQVGPALSLPTMEQPQTKEGWLKEGDSYFKADKYKEALQAYEQAVQLDPFDVMAHRDRGLALGHLGRHEEALAAYERVIELNPGYLLVYAYKGELLREHGQYEGALAAYEQGIEAIPKAAWFYNGKGDILREMNRFEEALAAYEEALQLDPHNALYYNNKGCALLDLQKPHEALEAYEHAIKLDPNYSIAYRNKGDVLYEVNRTTGALIAYKKAVELDPQDAYAFQGLGDVLMQLRRPQEALAAFEQVVALQPEEGLAYNSKGAALQELGKYAEALQAYERAIVCNPQDGFAWQNKGRTLKQLGRQAEGQKALQKASELGL